VSGPLVSKALAADLPGPEKLTLVALASHARADGTHCWPGKALLAAEVGRDTRTVQRHLQRLIGWGFVSLLSDHQGGRGRRDSYLIQIAKGEAVKGDTGVSLSGNKGRHGCRERETPLSLKGDIPVATYKEVTVRNRKEPSVVSASTSREPTRPTPAWDCPDWFRPLTTLEGYQAKNYSKLAKRIEETAAAFDVDRAAFVAEFAAYWPKGRALWSTWNIPTAVMGNNLNSQIKRFRNNQNNQRGRNGQVPRPDAAENIGLITRSQVT